MSKLQYGKQEDEFKNIQCESIRPDLDDFKKQGSSLIAVLERCKVSLAPPLHCLNEEKLTMRKQANFQQKQWDAGAFLAYDAKAMRKLGQPGTLADEFGVGDCLLKAHANRESNLGCMQDYLLLQYPRTSSAAVFWSYEKVENAALEESSDNVDACIVFSGPAKKQDDTLTTQAFRNCSHDYTGTGCMIPHMVLPAT